MRPVNDRVGMWMRQVLQRVWLQGKDPSMMGGGGTKAEDMTEVGWFVEVDGGGIFRKF